MSSTIVQNKTPNFGRRIKWLGILTAIVFALYSAGWFYVAQGGKTRIDEALEKVTQSGTPATCEQSEIKGFPFRFGVFCKSISFEQPQKGFSFSAGNLRSIAQVYNLKHAIIELDGPALLNAPSLQPLSLNWEMLRASIRMAKPLPQQVSVESKALQIAIRGAAGADTKILKADYASGHMRTEEANVAFAGEGGGVIIEPTATPDRAIPEFATSFDVVLNDGVAILPTKPKSLRGLSGTVRQSQFIFLEGGAINLSGPLKVDADGLIDGDLSIAFSDPKKLGIALSKAAPEFANIITSTLTTVGMASGADQEAKIEIKIRKGKVSTGFFPLGEIPPVQ